MHRARLQKYVSLLTVSLVLFAGCQQPITANTSVKAGTPTPATTTLAGLPDFTALVSAHGPAVVNISTTRRIRGRGMLPGFPDGIEDPVLEFLRRFGFGEMQPYDLQSRSLGSGFIIDTDGHILTNAHVVAEADEVMVGLTDKREFKAKVIGSDERTDVALLQISAKDLPFVTLGDPSRLKVGEWVIAIGAPFGFTNSVTQGIVSATGRALPGESIVPFIQTDVAVNPGNSGGPLFNMAGEVVAINSQIYSRSGGSMGISFAIPIDVAVRVKDELLKHGEVRRGRLGVTVQDINQELAESFHLPKASGALIASVEPGSPADLAGLQPGDIVLKFNDRELATSGDLARAVADSVPLANATLQIWRRNASQNLIVRIGDAGKDKKPATPKPAATTPDALGLSLRELARDEQNQLGTEGSILVETVEGIAAAAGIQAGDVIISLNNQPVSSVRQLRALLSKAGKRAALLVQRNRNTKIFIPLRLSED